MSYITPLEKLLNNKKLEVDFEAPTSLAYFIRTLAQEAGMMKVPFSQEVLTKRVEKGEYFEGTVTHYPFDVHFEVIKVLGDRYTVTISEDYLTIYVDPIAAPIPLEEILSKSLWIARMTNGQRIKGTYANTQVYGSMEECKDFDLCAVQPDELKPFFDKYFAYGDKHGFITIQDYWKNFYSEEF